MAQLASPSTRSDTVLKPNRFYVEEAENVPEEQPDEDPCGFQYDFLDEALEHPEGLGFKLIKNQNKPFSDKESCKTCLIAESRSQIDERYYSNAWKQKAH